MSQGKATWKVLKAGQVYEVLVKPQGTSAKIAMPVAATGKKAIVILLE